MLAGKPVPLDVPCKTPVQSCVLYIYHHETVHGLTEYKITEVVERIGMPIEYVEPLCFSVQDAPEFNTCQPDGVWFTDRGAHKIQGKLQGVATAVFVAKEPVVIE